MCVACVLLVCRCACCCFCIRSCSPRAFQVRSLCACSSQLLLPSALISAKKVWISSSHLIRGRPWTRMLCLLSSSSGCHFVTLLVHLSALCVASLCAHAHFLLHAVDTHVSMWSSAMVCSAMRVARFTNSSQGSSGSSSMLSGSCGRSAGLLLTSSSVSLRSSTTCWSCCRCCSFVVVAAGVIAVVCRCRCRWFVAGPCRQPAAAFV